MSFHFQNQQPRGFTLVEILVVVVIVSIALSIAFANLFVSDEERVRHEAERMLVLVEKTRDQATFSGYAIAMRLTDTGIEFLERDPNSVEPRWRASQASSLAPRAWQNGIRAELSIAESSAFTLSKTDADQYVMFLPAGVGVPFSLRVFSDQHQRIIEGDALGNVSFKPTSPPTP